ncbi:hypothetical protein LOZ12_005569 [Ophidiomyces ophidiicola]|uniref:Uncharacterized protein n=1 Tax=Ophidiomyces ophidiicola TaxID=1387563 RepID=A0ACB8USF9_9EURO|nr:uncharacterized protein LOZ57_002687 [Ophidiomyces ophidiicola]KAI1907298.1 hypothetical protein LOZ61_006219 [Ophidiomyces ophidiicola]KAI1911516.1 hypothetical protein LOZ64_004710 [Ophidiomyces ophidiicola]KAI1922281.1 hypothetical protein LOZ60_005811 [Ophidiomyces ophidiicola]KAI1945903.1 hypothetical protein LOZ62_003627 [Ophidiomyces ophidiicola]KAI1948336.1 hypothetical protein LOZ57_002687 [Ophidiomyces ophidiicola]
MPDQDSPYRPRSPDFSTFAADLPPEPYTPQHHPHAPPYAAYPPQLTPQASYDASPFFNPHVPRPSAAAYPPQPPFPPASFADMPPQTRSRSLLQHQQQPQQTPPPPAQYDPQSDLSAPQQRQPSLPASRLAQPPPGRIPPRVGLPTTQKMDQEPGAGPSLGIEIKTKFPVARIKRIMQADEDVGKVAQVTPIAVAKALELFMITLVTKAAQQAKDRSSKRVTATHLKEAIAQDEVLDFLADIISKVPDQPASKKDDDGSDPDEGRKKKGGGRRKKDDSDE